VTSGGWVDASEAGGGFRRGLDWQYEPRSSMDRRWVTSGGWVDASEAGGGFHRGLDWLQLCPFSGGSLLIGGSIALAVGGSTSCMRWLNGVDPVV